MKFNFDTDFFEKILAGEKPVTDVESEINIPNVGKFNLKIFDTKYLIQGVEYFRPFIRGFIVLLLAIWNVQQLLGFIHQDSGVYSSGKGDLSVESRGKKS